MPAALFVGANVALVARERTGLSSTELTDWRKKALFRLYRRPSWIFRTMRNAAANGNTMYYAREAWFRLNRLLRS